jgi:hypothetical protein
MAWKDRKTDEYCVMAAYILNYLVTEYNPNAQK